MKQSETKNRIIETAAKLFYKNGYNSTGINEIISESGIAKATLYSHFRSKEDICIAYLQFKNSTFIQDIRAFVASRKKGTSQVLAIFDFLQEFYGERDFNGCWCIKTVAEIPQDNIKIKKEIQSQKDNFIQLIEGYIAENMEYLKKEEISSLARKMYLLYEGAIGESHLHQQDWPIKEAKEIGIQIIA